MNTKIKTSLLLLTIICLNLGMLSAHDGTSSQPTNKLRLVMQGLLKDTHLLSEGVFYGDFKKIEQAAKNIADHPNPGMPTMKKVIGSLGKEMPKFKGMDTKVHNLAVDIAKSAKGNNMATVVSQYHQLIDACQSCHSQYKMRVSKILNKK